MMSPLGRDSLLSMGCMTPGYHHCHRHRRRHPIINKDTRLRLLARQAAEQVRSLIHDKGTF